MRIAILDDDPAQLAYLITVLKAPLSVWEEEVACVAFSKGEQLKRGLRRDTFDILVLDWNVPDLDGFSLLKWLRTECQDMTPVLMLSSRASESDVADALNHGADDYVIKPLRPVELRARLTNLFTRRTINSDLKSLRFGDWEFDRVHSCVHHQSVSETGEVLTAKAVDLTESEFKLALCLFQSEGKVVSRAYLTEKAGYITNDNFSRTLDTHIYRLRKKLCLDGSRGLVLNTVYGKGYRLDERDA